MTATLPPPTDGHAPRKPRHSRRRPGRPSSAETLSCPCCRLVVSEPAFVTHLLKQCPGWWSTW